MRFLFVMMGGNRAAILRQSRAARDRAAIGTEMAQVCVVCSAEIAQQSQRIREEAQRIRQAVAAQRADNEVRCVCIRPAFG